MAIVSKEEQDATGHISSPSMQRHSRTCSDSSSNTRLSNTRLSNTRLSNTCTNSTHDSTTPCLPESSTNDIATQDVEQNIGLRNCLRRYPKAIMWSVLFSLTLVMEGYSTILVPNLYSLDPFLRQFGTRRRNGDYQISAMWQSLLVNAALGGQIIGLFLSGWLAEKNGYRKTLMAALIACTAFITITFFAKSKAMLLAGQCLLGVPWGVFQTISTVYASDILPVGLRGYLTTYINACWVIGQLIASGVLRATLAIPSQWAYRIPFGLQWAFPIPIFVVVLLAPESPWWLVRQDKLRGAKDSLRRLRTQAEDETDAEFDASLMKTLQHVQMTDDSEKRAQSGTSYIDCFKGNDRRRTEITCMCWMVQTLCGSTFMGFSTYFYEQAGLAVQYAFSFSLGQFAIGLIGVLASWFLLAFVGRRTIYLSGQLLTFLCVLLIGILACIPLERAHENHVSRSAGGRIPTVHSADAGVAIPWAIAALLLVFTAVYDATIGPLCYTLVSEIPSTRLRAKTIVLARNCYNISGIVTNVITPRMLNPTAWAWGAKSGFFWAGTAVVGLVWSWFRLPETKGRTFAEIDVLFRNARTARKFKSTQIVREEARRDTNTSKKASGAQV
ncbi:sugar porter family MFS transporter [Stagonosporopsis vannaccii]|nr:sugar porter family MFS transporter [Stagonosporopsis vannaccii]